MLDGLDDRAEHVALTLPYLREDWGTLTIALALDEDPADIEAAIATLSRRGIVLARDTANTGLNVLPLTLDFLESRWNANDDLRRTVMRNMAKALADGRDLRAFRQLPATKQEEILVAGITGYLEESSPDRALTMAQLARQVSKSPLFVFLEGKALFLRGDLASGRFAMQEAVRLFPGSIAAEHVGFLCECLLQSGDPGDARGGTRLLLDQLRDTPQRVPKSSVLALLSYCIDCLDFPLITRLMPYVGQLSLSVDAARALMRLSHDSRFLFECAGSLLRLWMDAAEGADATKLERQEFLDLAERSRGVLKASGS